MSAYNARYALHRQRLITARRNNVGELAQLIADGWTQMAAAERLGVSQQSGNSYFAQIKKGLGYQALTVGDPVRPEFHGRPDLACAALARGEALT